MAEGTTQQHVDARLTIQSGGSVQHLSISDMPEGDLMSLLTFLTLMRSWGIAPQVEVWPTQKGTIDQPTPRRSAISEIG